MTTSTISMPQNRSTSFLFNVCRDLCFDKFGDGIFVIFYTISDPMMDPKASGTDLTASRPPCPLGKTHKCDLKGFDKFKLSFKGILHLCESCLGKTYKCAVIRKKKS